jgi:ATP-binding cassette subfamily B protein
MRYRRQLDNKRFAQATEEQNTDSDNTGMPDIKLANCEKQKRWQWEQIQVKLFKISIKGLRLDRFSKSVLFFSAS